jgi:hypothetical protein
MKILFPVVILPMLRSLYSPKNSNSKVLRSRIHTKLNVCVCVCVCMCVFVFVFVFVFVCVSCAQSGVGLLGRNM